MEWNGLTALWQVRPACSGSALEVVMEAGYRPVGMEQEPGGPEPAAPSASRPVVAGKVGNPSLLPSAAVARMETWNSARSS
ncbi:hypothetical protein GCM10012285_26420 [Streptomyces kronopolitis]|uniref:Uncharacterized protein n=1 Tax=Streptomyces kronopolitis TaxID=1612435 RepID=A0ABQ2JDA0_9ACTN|nr:hypothetical protein GCM10012285_26420 [Streptomyces kronopolitis]